MLQALQEYAIPSTSQLSAFYQSSKLPLPRTRSSASDYSANQYSASGSAQRVTPPESVHRAGSPLLRAHTRSSDQLSAPHSPYATSTLQPGSRAQSEVHSQALLQLEGQPISQRVTGDSLSSQQSSSMRSKLSADLGPHGPHVLHAGSGLSSTTAGSLAHSRKSSSASGVLLERVSASILQVCLSVTHALPCKLPELTLAMVSRLLLLVKQQQ